MVLSALHCDGKLIKNAVGDVVRLVGVNIVSFTGDSNGNWMDTSGFIVDNINNEFDIIKSWGCNCIRLPFAVDLWLNNTVYGGGDPFQTNIDNILTLADIKGLYVILDPHHLKADCSYTPRVSGYQNPLPYPPYQGSDGYGTDFSTIIANEAAFVAFMADLADTLKSHNNVIFATWNEPQDQGGTSLADYYDVEQSCITAIRNAGVTNLIAVMGENWGSPWRDIYTASGDGLLWFTNQGFTDSTGNLLIDAHNYRGHILNNGAECYLKSELNEGLSDMGFYTQSYPIIITETGFNLNKNTSEETQYLTNLLSLFNENDINYLAWAFWNVTSYVLHNGFPSATPTTGGQILIDAIANIILPETDILPWTDNFTDLSKWTIHSGDWSVANNILSGSGLNEMLITAGNTTWTDYSVVIHTIINTGASNNESSIVLMFTDINNYYWFGLGCWGHEYSISKMVNGTSTEIASSGLSSSILQNVSYKVKASIVGNTLTLYVNDIQVLQVTDSSLVAGKLGIRSYNSNIQVLDISAYSTVLGSILKVYNVPYQSISKIFNIPIGNISKIDGIG